MSTCDATTILILTSLSMKSGLQMAEQERWKQAVS